jgi:type II secretory pathway component PulC
MKYSCFIAMLFASCEVTAPGLPNQPTCEERISKMSFDSAPLGEVVFALSQATCKNFVVAENLKQKKLSLFVAAPLNAKDLIEGFQLALASNQLTLKEEGGFYTVLQAPPAASSAPSSTTQASQATVFAYTLDRATLSAKLADTKALAAEARIIPNMKDGYFNGYKLFAIRPSSFLASLGFQNGDLVQYINGESLESMEKLEEFFAGADKINIFRVSLIRKREPVEITITITE